MSLDPQQAGPGNRIKYNNAETDVVDRVTGESGNKYVVLSDPDTGALSFVGESTVIDDDNSEFVSTTAEAKDPERAKQAEAQAQKDRDIAEFDAQRSEFLKWQESQRTPVSSGSPTDPTVPTKS